LERLRHQLSLLTLYIKHALLHRTLHDKAKNGRLTGLAQSVNAVNSLVLDGRSPPCRIDVS
jgi:hypothetical protein